MRIYIIRHGESMAGLDSSVYEREDPAKVPLSQFGYEQSVEAGDFLKKLYAEKPELKGKKLRIYHSPLLRIQQTKDGFVEGLKDGVQFSVHEDELLTERNHGGFDRIVNEEAQRKKYPDIFDALHSPDYQVRYKTRMPGGESMEDIANRMKRFIDTRLKPDDKGKPRVADDEDVVILTHGTNCRALEMNLVPRNIRWYVDSKSPRNCQIVWTELGAKHPNHAVTLHDCRQRTASTPKDYKTEPYTPQKQGIMGHAHRPAAASASAAL